VAPCEYSVIGDPGFMACELWERTRSRVLDLCTTEQRLVQSVLFRIGMGQGRAPLLDPLDPTRRLKAQVPVPKSLLAGE